MGARSFSSIYRGRLTNGVPSSTASNRQHKPRRFNGSRTLSRTKRSSSNSSVRLSCSLSSQLGRLKVNNGNFLRIAVIKGEGIGLAPKLRGR